MTAEQTIQVRGGWLHLSRSRGALSGTVLVLLGAWGALVPFIGPSFGFGYTPDSSWTWTSARGWLELLPGVVVALSGLVLLMSANRMVACTAAWFAVAGGAWFVVGPDLAALLHVGSVGVPTGSTTGMRALESIAYFSGLGAAIMFFGAFALGRLSVRSLADIRAAQRHDAALTPDQPATGYPAAAPTTGGYPAAAPVAAAPAGTAEGVPAPESAGKHQQNDHAHRHFGRRGRPADAPAAGAPTDDAATGR